MSEDGYNGGGTAGGKLGCLMAALVGAPLFVFLLIGQSLGDCAPDVECHQGHWGYVVLPTAVVAIVIGVATRITWNGGDGNGS